jgi:hypothetical protein
LLCKSALNDLDGISLAAGLDPALGIGTIIGRSMASMIFTPGDKILRGANPGDIPVEQRPNSISSPI